jgi:hypothetical protein
MPELPEGFDSWEHLQKVYNTEYNKRVDKYFKDVEGNGDLSSPRASLKLACRLVDGDNEATFKVRTSLFFDVIGYGRRDLAVFYGSRLDGVAPVTNHPQLFLYFSQDSASVPINGTRVEHEKSCRLIKFSSKEGGALPHITMAVLLDIAREIKSLFVSGGKGITYTSGKLAVSYTDPENGFSRGGRWLVNSKSEAITLYEKFCNVIDRPFDINKIAVVSPEKDSSLSTSTQTDVILNKHYKKPRYRPVALVRFRYAYVAFGGQSPPIFLIDTTYRHTALIT